MNIFYGSICICMGLLGTYKSYCQELNDDFLRKNLWGYWKVRQESYTDGYPISHAESLSCNNEGFFFSTDSIVVAKGKCMLGETCYEPKYMYAKEGKTPESATYYKAMGLNIDSNIVIRISSCGSALLDEIVLIDSDKILARADNYTFILGREKSPFNLNMSTVQSNKCFLYSGPSKRYKTRSYLIKGDRIEVLQNEIYFLKIKYYDLKKHTTIINWVQEDDIE